MSRKKRTEPKVVKITEEEEQGVRKKEKEEEGGMRETSRVHSSGTGRSNKKENTRIRCLRKQEQRIANGRPRSRLCAMVKAARRKRCGNATGPTQGDKTSPLREVSPSMTSTKRKLREVPDETISVVMLSGVVTQNACTPASDTPARPTSPTAKTKVGEGEATTNEKVVADIHAEYLNDHSLYMNLKKKINATFQERDQKYKAEFLRERYHDFKKRHKKEYWTRLRAAAQRLSERMQENSFCHGQVVIAQRYLVELTVRILMFWSVTIDVNKDFEFAIEEAFEQGQRAVKLEEKAKQNVAHILKSVAEEERKKARAAKTKEVPPPAAAREEKTQRSGHDILEEERLRTKQFFAQYFNVRETEETKTQRLTQWHDVLEEERPRTEQFFAFVRSLHSGKEASKTHAATTAADKVWGIYGPNQG